jgi:malonate-semialdehyde dehydrogenase (acetylating) / methylmalonate-semialdehyde dehydrogenase
MGPVISPASKERIERSIAAGVEGGGRTLLDGRGENGQEGKRGNFLRPTVLAGIGPHHALATTEIFGPVLTLEPATHLDEAIALISQKPVW